MAYSTKFTVVTHMLVMLDMFSEAQVTSKDMAASIQTNPALVRKLLSLLKKGDLVDSTPGPSKTTLTRRPEEITLYDIYMAVEDVQALFTIHDETNQGCPVGKNIQSVMLGYTEKIEGVVRDEMQSITLADVIKDIKNKN